MLVNVSCDPKSRAKVEKRHRQMLQENPGIGLMDKDLRRIVKWHKKAFCFKGYFKPYKPRKWSFVPDEPNEDFTGIYIVPDTDQATDMVNMLTRQHAQNRYAKENYASGDIWYSYGLSDNASQVIKYYNEMKAKGRFPGNHIIVMSPMGKGGWRWHKWGTYIGKFEQRCEYFCDEEGIENVWQFDIVRVY